MIPSASSAVHQPRQPRQSGFTMLMVMFMVASMLIVAAAVTPSVLTEGRREKEAEMVWRGQQYTRAIGLYYKKFGKYPTKIEDLTHQTNGVRFLRQAYTDPMNKEDGSWRFIYVGPNGQLIGSLKQTSLLQTALTQPSNGLASALGGALQPLGGLPGAGGLQQPGATNGIGSGPQATNPGTAANSLEAQPQPLEGAVLGGNIIGVGSKIKKPSFKVYEGGDTYEQWEFIWNPTGQFALPGQAPVNPNTNPTGTPNPNTPNPQNGLQPQQTPGGIGMTSPTQ
jgi:hypothetical protein